MEMRCKVEPLNVLVRRAPSIERACVKQVGDQEEIIPQVNDDPFVCDRSVPIVLTNDDVDVAAFVATLHSCCGKASP